MMVGQVCAPLLLLLALAVAQVDVFRAEFPALALAFSAGLLAARFDIGIAKEGPNDKGQNASGASPDSEGPGHQHAKGPARPGRVSSQSMHRAGLDA